MDPALSVVLQEACTAPSSIAPPPARMPAANIAFRHAPVPELHSNDAAQLQSSWMFFDTSVGTGLSPRSVQGFNGFRGFTSDGLADTASDSQERQSSGLAASTSYAASEPESGSTEDTAMGTGEPVRQVLADTTCNADCQQHAGQVCMPANVKQDSQYASPLRLPLPSSCTPLRCRSRPRVARYRIVQSGIDSCLIRQQA